jgi:hypothetical protein
MYAGLQETAQTKTFNRRSPMALTKQILSLLFLIFIIFSPTRDDAATIPPPTCYTTPTCTSLSQCTGTFPQFTPQDNFTQSTASPGYVSDNGETVPNIQFTATPQYVRQANDSLLIGDPYNHTFYGNAVSSTSCGYTVIMVLFLPSCAAGCYEKSLIGFGSSPNQSGSQTGAISIFSFDGAHFMLNNVVSTAPLGSGQKAVSTQTFWDPQMYDPVTGSLSPNWYMVGLTFTPDQKARVDVFYYTSAGRNIRHFVWNEGYIDGGLPTTYGSTSRTPRGSNFVPALFGDELIDKVGSGLYYYATEGFPNFSGALTIPWYQTQIYPIAFTQDMMLAAFSQLSSGGPSRFNGYGTYPSIVGDSDLQGYTGNGSPNPQALYPCNSGAYLKSVTEVPVGYINTPCQPRKPIVPPPPIVTSMSPTQGDTGTYVTITGSGFGNQVSGDTVTFTRQSAAPYIGSWTDTQIVLNVPQAVTGPVTVVLSTGVTANAGVFTFNE